LHIRVIDVGHFGHLVFVFFVSSNFTTSEPNKDNNKENTNYDDHSKHNAHEHPHVPTVGTATCDIIVNVQFALVAHDSQTATSQRSSTHGTRAAINGGATDFTSICRNVVQVESVGVARRY